MKPPVERKQSRIAVVIPSYRVKPHILAVLDRIGAEVSRIYVVDDGCPDATGNFVEQHNSDPRVTVLFNAVNQGVGGATLTGMQRAVEDGAEVIVKIDGDGQMDPSLIPVFVNIILNNEADYSKGNRFFEPEGVSAMPLTRLIGNAGLSLLAKLSSGYWHTFDPTNGYIAIHGSLVPLLPVSKIAKRYFFESDMLFRLNLLNAVVVDIPMHAHYSDEISHLKPHKEILRFAALHARNFSKRLLYNYFIRNFSIASVELLLGTALMLSGIAYGLANWGFDKPATSGTVMVAALQIIIGAQLLLAFINYDIQSIPRSVLHVRLKTSAQQLKALRYRGNSNSSST